MTSHRRRTESPAVATTPRQAGETPWRSPSIALDREGDIACYLPEPPSANRWWRNVNGRMVTSKAARDYKRMVAALASASHVAPFTGPVRFRMIWHRGRKSGDLDKRLGVLLDALQGVAFENDSQVAWISAERWDSPNVHSVVVHVSPLTPVGAGR